MVAYCHHFVIPRHAPNFPKLPLLRMQSLAKLDIPEIRRHLLKPQLENNGCCPTNAEDLSLTICEGVVLACRFYLAKPDSPTVIYFHGGGESSDSFDMKAESFIQAGMNVFLTSMRGFGKSTGIPALSTLLSDAEIQFSLAIKWLAEKKYSGPITLMGRSLGSVCALHVVAHNLDSIKAMILESAFCETLPLLTALGVETSAMGISEDDGFHNLEKIAQIKTPTLLLHGSRDILVPVSQAEKLQSTSGAKNKQFLIIPGAGHDSVSQSGGQLYFSTIKGFIDTVCGINTWRQRRKKFQAKPDGGH